MHRTATFTSALSLVLLACTSTVVTDVDTESAPLSEGFAKGGSVWVGARFERMGTKFYATEAAQASFWEGGTKCRVTAPDTFCTVSNCVGPRNVGRKKVDAGTIRIRSTAATTPTLKPSAAHDYEVFTSDREARETSPWLAGDRFEFNATGSGIPAFSSTLPMPSSVRVAPNPIFTADFSRATVERNKDYALHWSNGDVGSVQFAIYQTRWKVDADLNMKELSSTFVECLFPSAAGKARVPRAALAQLKAGPSSPDVSEPNSEETTNYASLFPVSKESIVRLDQRQRPVVIDLTVEGSAVPESASGFRHVNLE